MRRKHISPLERVPEISTPAQVLNIQSNTALKSSSHYDYVLQNSTQPHFVSSDSALSKSVSDKESLFNAQDTFPGLEVLDLNAKEKLPFYPFTQTSTTASTSRTRRHTFTGTEVMPFIDNMPSNASQHVISSALAGTMAFSGQLRYNCPFCTKSFTRPYNLKSHFKTHSGERPFKCNQCTMSFSRNHDLRRHQKIHSGVKPFRCHNCNKFFSRMDALTRHCSNKGCPPPL
jgi:uncharacterized Zn-finger protein